MPKALILKLLPPRIFACSRSSADAEIVKGVWPNQEPLLLSERFFFFLWKNGAIFFSFLGWFFRFIYPRTFSAFDLSIEVSVKSFHLGILSSTCVNKTMQLT